METPFVPKPTEPPQGDPSGQAIASLRGYAYQLIASGVAWLKLADDEELYLEVAQDYATAAREALNAVQVKDTQANVTINSAGVRQAIDDFVDLVERNPGRRVTLRFLSTSEIGKEQKAEHRVGTEPTLKYWSHAAEGAEVAPLRTIFEKLELDSRTSAFIESRNDEQLRDDLLRRIIWDCGAPGLEDVTRQLEEQVVLFANAKLNVPPSEAKKSTAHILRHLLSKAVEPDTSKRKLTRIGLLELLEAATHISLPHAGLETHVKAAVADALAAAQVPTSPLQLTPSPQLDIAKDALERDFASRYRQALQRNFFPEAQKEDLFQPLAQQIIDGRLVVLSQELRRRIFLRAARSAAFKKDLPATERYIASAAGLSGPDTDLPAKARLAEAKGEVDKAIQLLRDATDPDSRSTLFTILAKARGDDAALGWLAEQKINISELTTNGIASVCNTHLRKEDYAKVKEIVQGVSAAQIDECPYLLLLCGAIRFASVLAKPEQHLALMGMQLDIRRVRPILQDTEVTATLDAAIQDMQRVIPLTKDLGLHETVRLAEYYIFWLELVHPTRRTAALARLTSEMQEPAIAPKRVQFALAYLPKFDAAPLLKHLENRAALGGLNEDELRAGLAIRMDDPQNTAPLAAFIAKHRDELDEVFGKQPIRMIEIQALARAGDAAGARSVLDANRDLIKTDELARLDAVISTAEGDDPVTAYKRAYETTKTTESLRNLIAVLSQRDDYRSIGPYAEELFAQTGDPLDLGYAARAYAHAGDNANFVRVVESKPAILDRDAGLVRHYGWQLLNRGRLQDARLQAEKLGENSGVHDLDLEIAIAIESGEWETLAQPLSAYLQSAAKVSALSLIRAAHIAQASGQGPLMDLISAAVAKGGDDPNVLLGAYTLYVEEGLEDIKDEAQEWFRRALSLSGPDGPIQQFELKDILEKQTEWNEQTRRMQEGISRGDIPLMVGVLGLRTTVVDVLLRNFTRNSALSDARRRVAIPVFSGRRLPNPIGVVKRIALDFSTLLVLGWLGLLPKVLEAFPEIVLPSGIFRDLFDGRRRIREFQKSRLKRAEHIQQVIASGKVKVVRSSLSRRDPLVEEVGDELAGLLRTAEAANGIVLRPAPVHKPGLENRDADVSAFATRMTDTHRILGVLKDNGLIDLATEESAKRYFTLQDKGWPSPARPDPARPLYIEGLGLIYLDSVDLLDKVLNTFPQVFIDSSTAEEAAALVEHDNHTAEVLRVIDAVRDAIRRAQRTRTIIFGPRRASTADDDDGFESSTLNLISNLAQAEVAVIDDRALNKETSVLDNSGHRARAVTSLDVIEELRSRNIISDDERRALRHRLRVAGAGLVPIDMEEIVVAALRSTGVDSAELRAIKDSILLARVAALPRFPSEVPWFATATIAIKNAIMAIWAREPDHARAAILANAIRDLQASPEDWVGQWDGPVPPGWIDAVNIALVAGLALPVELQGDELTEAYNRWAEDYVLNPLRERAPQTYAAVVEHVRKFINSVAEDDDDE